MVPPLEGGIDSNQTLQLFVSPVTAQYRNRSESLNESMSSCVQRVSRHSVPSNPDKITMVARKGTETYVLLQHAYIFIFLGNIGPPVPPRSQISLKDESIYVVPNQMSFKRPCELMEYCLLMVKPL